MRKDSRQKNYDKNIIKLNSLVLPLFIFGLSEGVTQIIIWVLVGIIILLFIYIVYLFMQDRKNRKPVTNKETVTIYKETVYVKDNKDKVVEAKKDEPIKQVKEEPKPIQTVVETKPLKEEPKPVEPVQTTLKVVPVVLEPEEEVSTEDDGGLKIRYNYSFKARMHQAPIESQLRFSELKNYILEYPNIEVKESWKYQRFMYNGKPILKAWIHGNNLKLYFNLNPQDYVDSKYNLEDVSYAKMHETTPSLFMVNGPRLLEYAKELVDDYMKGKETKTLKSNVDYTEKFISRDELIKMKLVKVNFQG